MAWDRGKRKDRSEEEGNEIMGRSWGDWWILGDMLHPVGAGAVSAKLQGDWVSAPASSPGFLSFLNRGQFLFKNRRNSGGPDYRFKKKIYEQ